MHVTGVLVPANYIGIVVIFHLYNSQSPGQIHVHTQFLGRGLTWTLLAQMTALEMEMVEVPTVERAWKNEEASPLHNYTSQNCCMGTWTIHTEERVVSVCITREG